MGEVHENVLCIIPARGGSKGVPRKNLAKLGKFNLLQISIRQCLDEGIFNKIVVSSEDEEILKVAMKFENVEVIERPMRLAQDHSSSVEVIEHALETLRTKGEFFGLVCLVEATSPLRRKGDIASAVGFLQKNSQNFDACVTVCEVRENPTLQFRDWNGRLIPILGKLPTIMRRQELEVLYYPYGGVYVSKVTKLIEVKNFYTSRLASVVLKSDQALEIDNSWELEFARCAFRKTENGTWIK